MATQHWQTHTPVLVSLCMIVRDNARIIQSCLSSMGPWVDEMVVVDTGSRDDTPNVPQELGARVFHFPWCDDFSAARNESLRHARGQWLFWMDSDDTIDADNGGKLRELAYGPHRPATLGYVMQVHCPGHRADGVEDLTVVDHVKMFRKFRNGTGTDRPGRSQSPAIPEIRFEFRIHEQVLPSIRRLGGEVQWTDIFVVHSGADQSPEGRRRKIERDLRILALEIQERPDHPFVLFNLGMTYADMEDHQTAATYLRRCLQVSDANESHLRKAYALLVSSLHQLARRDEAWQLCQAGRALFPDDAELAFRQGTLAHARGRLEEAEQAYLAALDSQPARHFSSMDPGMVGYKSRHNLAMVYQDLGRLDLAEVQWRHAAAEVPTYRPGRRGLVDTLIVQRRFTTAEVEIERIMNEPTLRCDALVLKARLAEARGDHAAAQHELKGAVGEFPAEIEPLDCLCKFLFERDQLAEAEQALEKLMELGPDNAATHHNLGVVYLRRAKPGAAVQPLRQSLRLRPDSATTWEHLAEALEWLGRTQEAEDARQQAKATNRDGLRS